MKEKTYAYSRGHRAVEILCISAVFVLLAGFAVQIARIVSTPGGWLGLGVTALVAYLAADLVSGLVHWAGDTLGNEQTPFVGPNFVRPFREHHTDPKGITHHDFIETNGNNCIVVLAPLALAFAFLPGQVSLLFFVASFVAFLVLFIVATNQFHKWAHADNPPAFARVLQRWGLVLPPGHHAIHHARPHDRHYCITVGWMNPVLNGVRFFRIAEWLVARVSPNFLYIEERRAFAAERERAAASR